MLFRDCVAQRAVGAAANNNAQRWLRCAEGSDAAASSLGICDWVP